MFKIKFWVVCAILTIVYAEETVENEASTNKNDEVEVIDINGTDPPNKIDNQNETPGNQPDNNNLPKPGYRAIPGEKGVTYNAKENLFDYSGWDSLQSDYAPQLGRTNEGAYIITEARLKQIRSEMMYWYFDKGGDENDGDWQRAIQASTPQVNKNLNFQLPFFGFRYNYTRISINGYLEFSDPPENYPVYPITFPVPDWPKVNDPAFIGIWHSKCRVGVLSPDDLNQRKPGVYFRMERDLENRKDQFGVEMRERVKWDIRTGMIGAETFSPKHSVIVTWKNVSFAGGHPSSLTTTNTFQLVLATDEVFTYAIFNYLDIQWTTHTEARGDPVKGEGGVPAFIGFNAGNGTRAFEYEPYSQTHTVRDLPGRGWGNGFKGRHIFRIDENIMLGSCNYDIDGPNLPLVFAPESGNMLGGTLVNITGPCFKPSDKVRCKFDTENEVYGTVVGVNRAVCVQPQLFVEGYINLQIAIGSGTYKWKGRYFIETPATASQKIFFEDYSVHEKDPAEIKISWVNTNLTTNENANIRVSLWGYRETNIRPEFLYIDQVADGLMNTGVYTISPAAYRNRDNRLLSDIKFGFLQINLTEPIPIEGTETRITPLIWSRPIPLGWYFGSQWRREYGDKYVEALCEDWLRTDRNLRNFAHELPQCPCTLEQALSDKGRFIPDFDCDKDLNSKCQYNRGSVHCVRTGSPTLEGSEQQCCYDKNNFLMLSYDQQWGSSPHRSHNLGYLPWNEANKVPTLSHWFHDMVPKYLCCLWQYEQSVGCETLRFERRPTQDCIAYQAPAIAGVYGDPHIITYDDVEYTFNGKGEFVLTRTLTKDNRLDVQARFEQLSDSGIGEVRATQLTSIVARGNSSIPVEVRIRPANSQWRYRLDVFADEKRVYFDRPSLKYQHFPGVTVYTPNYILNQSEVLILFDSGAGVEVIENKGYMSARVYLPWTFINKTRGLFGNWSFDMVDDFIDPHGQTVGIPAGYQDYERIYNEFGMKWMLDDSDDPTKGKALFHREFSRTSSYYNNRTFKPEFKYLPEEILSSNRTPEINRAYEYCADYAECRYDYAMTLNRDLAHFTHNYKSSIKNLKEINRRRIISCGVLETPRFGRKSNFLFIPGTKVTFECNQEFILVGDQRRECTHEGRWDVPAYGYTECLRQQEYSSRQAGITFGIVLAVVIPIILCLAFIMFKLYKNREKNDNNSWLFNPPSRSASRLKLNETENETMLSSPRTLSPTTPPSDGEFNRYTYTSPVNSERSSGSSDTSKKRRSYDRVYRTHEPLEGVPEIEFEDKPWDLDPTFIDEQNPKKEYVRSESNGPEYSVPYKPANKLSASNPNLLDHNLSYNTGNYSIPYKTSPNDFRPPVRSQSSIITDV